MGQMSHVGHSIQWITIESLKIVLMGADNHQVRANVKLMAGGTIFRLPGAEIHVRDADAINLRRAAGKAVLHPAQEDRVEAPWLIVRISRNSRKTGPFARSFAKSRYSPSGDVGQSRTVASLAMMLDRRAMRPRSSLRQSPAIGETRFTESVGHERALERLRDVFGDPLLVCNGRRYESTVQGERVLRDFGSLMSRLEGIVRGEKIDPARSGKYFARL